jgi:hypothetical protein
LKFEMTGKIFILAPYATVRLAITLHLILGRSI